MAVKLDKVNMPRVTWHRIARTDATNDATPNSHGSEMAGVGTVQPALAFALNDLDVISDRKH